MTEPSVTRPQAVIFDVNETLTDMEPLRDRFEEAGLPRDSMDTWFASVLRDGFALTVAGGYADFAAIAAEVLKELLVSRGAADGDVDPGAAVDHVLGAFRRLRVHPDIPEGMRLLHESGIRLFTMTNGAAAMTEGVLAREGLLDLVEARLDVSAPRAWKPARAAYEYAVGATGVRPDQAALIAVHPWDIDGAQRAGLTGAWLNRRGLPYPGMMTTPRVTAPDLVTLAGRWA